jgi:hypothetical protein
MLVDKLVGEAMRRIATGKRFRMVCQDGHWHLAHGKRSVLECSENDANAYLLMALVRRLNHGREE